MIDPDTPPVLRIPRFRRAGVAAALLIAAAPVAGDDATAPSKESVAEARASVAAAYDRADCKTVLDTLAGLARTGVTLDGLDEYRRGFCLARTRQQGAEDAYGASAALLSDAARAKGDVPLEVHFYRVNAFINLGRMDDARSAAAEAVARWKAGTLVVSQDDPSAWFRLGKIHRDAEDNDGALEPFRRALDVSQSSGQKLRSAYLDRIARAARQAGDTALATRAAEMAAASGVAGPEARLRAGIALVTKGQLEDARKTFLELRKQGGTLAMKGQYASEAMERALELERWERTPATALPDGRSIAALETAELQAELFAVARDAALLFQEGAYVVRDRTGGAGIFHAATPEVRESLRDIQARLAGLLLEAVQRDAPLREWAVSGGYANMIHTPLQKLFRRQASERAEKAGESPLPLD